MAKAKKSTSRKQSKKDTGETGVTKDAASNTQEVENIQVPDEALIKRDIAASDTPGDSASVSVRGDQRVMVMDVMHKRPVEVVVVDGNNLNPEMSGVVVLIFGQVSNDFCTEAQARSKFAKQKDGTIIFNSRGFDDVPASAEYDLVDIVKLAELNHSEYD